MEEIRITVERIGKGSNPLVIEENYKCYLGAVVKCNTEEDRLNLIGFIKAGINAYEDDIAERNN